MQRTLTKAELIARSKTDKRLARELLSYGSITYGAGIRRELGAALEAR